MTFVELLQKSLTDREFGNLIITDPEGALTQAGITPTPEKLRALKDASLALLTAKSAFEVDNI